MNLVESGEEECGGDECTYSGNVVEYFVLVVIDCWDIRDSAGMRVWGLVGVKLKEGGEWVGGGWRVVGG